MGDRYGAGGRMNAATSATADHVAALLWNPHASISLYVVEVHFTKTAATADNHGVVRTTTEGATFGATVTPDIDNHFARRYAPISGAVIRLAAITTQPTLAPPYITRTNLPAAVGAGWMYGFHDEPIEVPAGTGLAVATPTAVAVQISDVTYIWDE